MIIPFWSTHHGQARVTCSMMCVSIMSALEYKIKAIMTQTHFNLNNLEGPFLGFTEQKIEDDYLGESGLGALFKSFKSEPLSKSIVEECSVNIIPNSLSLLPGHYIGNWELFKYDMEELLPTVLQKMNDFSDYIFVDTPSGANSISEMIISLADLVVVCLNQNPSVIKSFFENYEFWKEKKVFYLIGDYDCNSAYNYKYILSKYPQIKFSNSAVIPYNTNFKDSLVDASTVDYFMENYKKEYLEKTSKNYFFMSEVELATNKILRLVGEKRKR